MQKIVLDETHGDMDRNGDGYITQQEYIGMFVCVYVCMCVSTLVCVYVCVCEYIGMYVCVCV